MIKDSVLFSIIIPTYNRAGLINKTVLSVLNQTYPHFEILVVDDGSTDNTEEVLKKIKDPRLHYFKKENGERGAARNFGQRKAIGGYVNFFDSDDLMYANHLEEANELIQTKDSPELFHLGYDFQTVDGTVTKKIDQLNDDIATKAFFDNFLSCNGVFIRMDIAREFPFEENRILASAEDWELWIRLMSRYRLYYSNKITSSVVEHEQRSLRTIAITKTIDRDLFLINCLKNDERVMQAYGSRFNQFIAERYTFFMLCLAEDGRRQDVILWVFKAFKAYPVILTSRRFWVSIKKLF